MSGLTKIKAEAEASLATLQWDDDDFDEGLDDEADENDNSNVDGGDDCSDDDLS